jgi:phosphoserine aminotransferase
MDALARPVRSEDNSFNHIPDRKEWNLNTDASYIHYTSNNTVYGTQFRELPDFGDKTVVCDMSSDIMSRPVDVSKFGLIYAGAQKNAGPSGVTIVIIRDDLLEINATKNLPTMSNYKNIAAKDSMLNTPPSYSIYIVGLVLEWIESIWGLAEIEKRNIEKANLIYDTIDNSDGFYQGFAAKKDRSLMNVTFKLPTPELDQEFIKEATENGLIGIKGYRTVGGIRASIYNAHPIEGVKKLVELMKNFKQKH